MTEQKPVHPVVKILLWIFLLTFFGGGLLVFVNNVIVTFLPERAAEIIGGIVLIEIIALFVISKCVSGVKMVRRISGTTED